MPEFADSRARYRVDAASYLTDAGERRFVRISPGPTGYVVDCGELGVGAEPVFRSTSRTWFARGELSAAVQRFAALTGEWLGFDEFEIEQARRLFVVDDGS